MSAFQDKLNEQDAQLRTCEDHIVEKVNKHLDIIKHTGVFEFDAIRSCGTATIYLDSKIARNPFHFSQQATNNSNPKYLHIKDLLKRIPRIQNIAAGPGGISSTYYVHIQHGDPEDWPELKELPVLPCTLKERFSRWLNSKGLRW